MQMESSCARYFSLHNFTPPNISFIQDIVNGNLLMAQKVSKELMRVHLLLPPPKTPPKRHLIQEPLPTQSPN